VSGEAFEPAAAQREQELHQPAVDQKHRSFLTVCLQPDGKLALPWHRSGSRKANRQLDDGGVRQRPHRRPSSGPFVAELLDRLLYWRKLTVAIDLAYASA
jgi:hypothetical protein